MKTNNSFLISVIILLFLFTSGIISLYTWYPPWQLLHDSHITNNVVYTDDFNITNNTFKIGIATLENQYRSTGIQILGSLLVIIGLILTYLDSSFYKESQMQSWYNKSINELNKGKNQLNAINDLLEISQFSDKFNLMVIEGLALYIRTQPSFVNRCIIQEALDVIKKLKNLKCTKECNGLDLHGAYLRGANLMSIILYNANLHETNLENANLANAELKEVNLSNSKLGGINLELANIEDSDLRNTDLNRSNLHGVNLKRANISNANLSYANLSKSILSETYLRGANLTKADLTEVDFKYADISNVNFKEANIDKANFYRANFTGANFMGAVNLDIKQFSPSSTLKNAKFDEKTLRQFKENKIYRVLFD